MADLLRLGVNIDHVATIRNARGQTHPDPLRAAQQAVEAGADGITAHLREDRRHISDTDIRRLRDELACPLNLELAATAEMHEICLRNRPHACCIVPEKREERTTEGGLDAAGQRAHLRGFVHELLDVGIRVSLFVEPERRQLEAVAELGVPVVEMHTGAYCEAALKAPQGEEAAAELERVREGARIAANLGLECHAGHGLTFDTVQPIAAIPSMRELNIGHFLIGEAIFTGLEHAVTRMRRLMAEARRSMVETGQ